MESSVCALTGNPDYPTQPSTKKGAKNVLCLLGVLCAGSCGNYFLRSPLKRQRPDFNNYNRKLTIPLFGSFITHLNFLIKLCSKQHYNWAWGQVSKDSIWLNIIIAFSYIFNANISVTRIPLNKSFSVFGIFFLKGSQRHSLNTFWATITYIPCIFFKNSLSTIIKSHTGFPLIFCIKCCWVH